MGFLAGYKFIEVNNSCTDDLSNQYCDIPSKNESICVIEHKMCIYSRKRSVTECFETLCNDQNTICAQENKLLVKNEADNETVVSIFCTGTKGTIMVYNREICKKTIIP